MNQRLERQGNGGRCPPNPLGFSAWRQKRWLGWRTRDECPACRRATRLVRLRPPAWRSGCVPAEPYPPADWLTSITHIESVFISTQKESAY